MVLKNACLLVLFSLEFVAMTSAQLFWNPTQILHENLRDLTAENIMQEAKKSHVASSEQDSLRSKPSNVRSYLPFLNAYGMGVPAPSRTNLLSVDSPTSQPEISDYETTTSDPGAIFYEVDRPVTKKPKNPAFHFPWNSRVAFPIFSGPTNNNAVNMAELKPKEKKPEKAYNPLCFFSALPCSSRRQGVMYVPRKY